jgi:hypothetical protein
MRLALPALLLFSATALAQTPTATLTIDASHPTGQVSPTLYGIMSEEINHAWDGGLYAELLNPSAIQVFGRRPGRPPQNWILIERGSSEAAIATDTGNGPSAALTASLKLDSHLRRRALHGRLLQHRLLGHPRPSCDDVRRARSTRKPPTPPSVPSPSASSTTKPEPSPPPPPSPLSIPSGNSTPSP